MKRSEIFFNAILVPIDYFLVVGAALLAYFIRSHSFVIQEILPFFTSLEYIGFQPASIQPVFPGFTFNEYLRAILWFAPFVVAIFALEGLYNMKTTRSKLSEFYNIFAASSTALLILIIFVFLNREFFSSRFIILTAWILIILFATFFRIIIRFIQEFLAAKKGIGIHRVLIIGKNSISKAILGNFKNKPKLGYRVVGNIERFNWDRLKTIKESKGIDEIIQCNPELSRTKVNALVRFSDIYKIEYKYIPNLFESHAINIDMRQIAGFPVIELTKTPLDGWGKVIKRIFDIIFSLFFLVIFFPVYLVMAFLVKISSSGPVIYKDYRCGYRKKKFKFFKFRTLRHELCDGELGTKEGNKLLNELIKDKKNNTRPNGPLHKIKNDPRLTKFGKFIRKYSLDELPQFINVLKGEMSVVGYRPHMSYEVDKYNYDQQRMFYIKPGITGLAQISGRSDLDFDEEVRLDVYYMENWSLLMDLAIIFKTPFVLFRRRRVE